MSITLGILMSLQLHVGVQPAAAEQSSDREGTYIVLFTTRNCGPCQRWKRDERPKLDAARIPITIVDVDEDGRWGVSRVPTFWIVDLKTRKPLRKFSAGYLSAETLIPMMGGTQPTQVRATMSHAEMVRLHNNLHGGGSWTWPGDLREHLRRVHGAEVN